MSRKVSRLEVSEKYTVWLRRENGGHEPDSICYASSLSRVLAEDERLFSDPAFSDLLHGLNSRPLATGDMVEDPKGRMWLVREGEFIARDNLELRVPWPNHEPPDPDPCIPDISPKERER